MEKTLLSGENSLSLTIKLKTKEIVEILVVKFFGRRFDLHFNFVFSVGHFVVGCYFLALIFFLGVSY